MKSVWRWGALAVALVLVLGITSGLAQQQIKNPDTYIYGAIGDLETLDPAWHYDFASATAIFNMYDSLIFYRREKIDEFEPALAESWTVSPDGKTYTFKIKKNIKFHEGGDLSPDDVAYSLQRGLLQDRAGGPQWILLEPILGVSSIDDLARGVGDVKACEMVKDAISVQGDNVVIKLKIPFSPMLQILASPWGSVLDKEWMIAQGDWDGKCDNWRRWHDPAAEKSTIFNKANGTGPYKLEKWTPDEEIRFTRFDGHWRGKAPLAKAVIKVMPEWGTRLAAFQAGDLDSMDVPRAFVAQMDPLVQQGKAVMYKDLPTNTAQDAFINFQVAAESPFTPLLGRDKKPDLFSDIHMRKALNYCFDTDTYIKDAWLGEAKKRRGPIPTGLLGYNPEQPYYEYSLEKCKAELQAAWGGKVWSDGFQVTLTYNTGNVQRKIAAELLEKNLESFRGSPGAPSINVNVLDMPWPSYLKAMDAEQLAIWWMGWWEDYHHPHNWVQPYMYMESNGAFGGFQQFEVVKDVDFKPTYATFLPAKKYANLQELFDDLIEKALLETDLKKQEKIYFELQKLAMDWAIDIFQVEPVGRRYFQPWVKGWYHNPAYPGDWFFVLFKGVGPAVVLVWTSRFPSDWSNRVINFVQLVPSVGRCAVLDNVDLINKTGYYANNFEVVLDGSYTLVDYYTDPRHPAAFDIQRSGGVTVFRWRFHWGISPDTVVHLGLWVAESDLRVKAMLWTKDERIIGKVPASSVRCPSAESQVEIVNNLDEPIEVDEVQAAQVAQPLPLQALNGEELPKRLKDLGVELQRIPPPVGRINPGQAVKVPIQTLGPPTPPTAPDITWLSVLYSGGEEGKYVFPIFRIYFTDPNGDVATLRVYCESSDSGSICAPPGGVEGKGRDYDVKSGAQGIRKGVITWTIRCVYSVYARTYYKFILYDATGLSDSADRESRFGLPTIFSWSNCDKLVELSVRSE